MINNEFHIIGYAVSDYKLEKVKDKPLYTLLIEVDYGGSLKGMSAIAKVYIKEKITTIDLKQSVRGKQVIVSGLINFLQCATLCMATSVIVLGNKNYKEIR